MEAHPANQTPTRSADIAVRANPNRPLALLLLLPFPALLGFYLAVVAFLQFQVSNGSMQPVQAGGAVDAVTFCLIVPLWISLIPALVGVVLGLTRWRSSRDPVIWALALLDLLIMCAPLSYYLYTSPRDAIHLLQYDCRWLTLCR
jgi:hypothetical protein